MIFLRKEVVLSLLAFLAASAHIVMSSECVAPYNEVEGHTACREASPNLHAPDSFLTEEEKMELLKEHNIRRAMVAQAGATDMLKMYWSEEAAMLAQKWADTCETGHDLSPHREIPNKYTHGQNIHEDSVKPKMAEVVEGWYNEIKDFTFGVRPAPDVDVEHFTQLAWSASNLLGCGIANCTSRPYPWTVFCNYAIGGNTHPEDDPDAVYRPYSPGLTCASCPDTCNDDGLCDCNMDSGDVKMCYAGAQLDRDTCKCSCKYDTPWITDQCDVDCTKAADTSYCNIEKHKDYCSYSNWPYQYCPFYCNLCEVSDTSSNTSEKRGTSKVNSLAQLLLKVLSNKMHQDEDTARAKKFQIV